jgi:hypothetical protein
MTDGGSAAPEPPDDKRNVKIAVMAGVIVVLVVSGTWLLNAMIDIRKAEDCTAERRRNCAGIEIPDQAR